MNLKEFNKKVSVVLDIDLDKPAKQKVPHLMNVFAEPNSKIKSITLSDPKIYENGSFRDLTDEELNSTVLEQEKITLTSFGKQVTHRAPNGKSFSVKDLLDAVEKTERVARPDTDWFGGIDCHHIYFEGAHIQNGMYHIYWGS